MSVCKKDLEDTMLRDEIAELYRESLLTMEQVAEELGTGHHTVCLILEQEIPPEELRKLKALKYSVSKQGEKNPMLGKKPGNYKGDCPDGNGYLTRVVNGKRHFVHRIVFAAMLGIPVEALPASLIVHHIDENPLNNNPDNLALSTETGHVAIHQRMKFTANELKLKGLTLAEAIQYMTSK